jgi:hypothetical protein
MRATPRVIRGWASVLGACAVVAINEATADARTTVSGGQGTLTFQAGAPGSYTVKIEL